MGSSLAARLLVCCFVALAAPGARAQGVSSDEVPLAELLDVLIVDRDLLAISGRRGGQVTERLQLDESLLWLGARGKVGVAITTRRILSVATGSGSWQETTYLRGEQPPLAPILGDRVALVLTDRRALGVDGGSGNLVEYRLGPKERLIASQVGRNVAVCATERAALGLSPIKGGFFPVKLSAAERIEAIDTGANLATLTTNRRVLIFRTPTGTWEERNRNLN
ncbi:MAG TPA: hypothetical protein VII72_05300 [Myxococcota bacterium]|jgi:hypothetical protein